MSKKALNIASKRPMLLALIVMATITIGLLFSGWLAPVPIKAQNNDSDPNSDVETTNCVQASITTNSTEATVTLTNVPPIIICLGSSVSASTVAIVTNAYQILDTSYTNAGNSGNDKCPDDYQTNTLSTPAMLTNWWAASGCGLGTNSTGCGLTTTALNPTIAGDITVTFNQTWRHTLDTNTEVASVVGTIMVYGPIEADLTDTPPDGATYASGINTNSVVLKLNGTNVAPAITNIANGIHVYYKPTTNELVFPGNNTIEINVKDKAGNPTGPDPFTWTFSL